MKRLLVISALILFSLAAAASPKNDPAVRRGVLPNGLTYYIRNNGYPEGFADFHLVVKAGFVDQKDEKSGVAHFLEHVCFNGSEHFPGNSMIEWLRGNGVAYGENFNAVTNEENTIFNISNVPVRKPEVVDSCILILHDLAHSVEITEASVEKERPVILEERRFIDSPASRVADASRRYIYGDTKHGRYDAAGSEEAVGNITVEALQEFYREWYRPDLQAVIIVGGINVNDVENTLKKVFADIPAASSEVPERRQSAVYSDSPVVGLIPDSELVTSGLNVLWRLQPRKSAEAYRESVLRFMLCRLIDLRLSDEASSLGSPILEVKMAMSRYSTDLDAFEVSSYVVPGHELKAFESIMTVVEKVRRFGFDDAETRPLGEEMLAYYSDLASGVYSMTNSQLASVLTNNFLYGMPYMAPADEYAEVAKVLKSIDASVLSGYADEIFSQIEPVVICSYPSRSDMAAPEEADFLAALDGIRSSEMEVAGVETVVSELPDLSDLEVAKVEDSVKYSDGTYAWYLENGMRVVFVPASKGSDVIGVELFWNGGLSQVPTGELAVFEDNLH